MGTYNFVINSPYEDKFYLDSPKAGFFINYEKTLSANLQFATDGCAQTSFELVWVTP